MMNTEHQENLYKLDSAKNLMEWSACHIADAVVGGYPAQESDLAKYRERRAEWYRLSAICYPLPMSERLASGDPVDK